MCPQLLKIVKANCFKITCDYKVIIIVSLGGGKNPHEQIKQHLKQTINATLKPLRSLLYQIESLKLLDILTLTFMQLFSFKKLYYLS